MRLWTWTGTGVRGIPEFAESSCTGEATSFLSNVFCEAGEPILSQQRHAQRMQNSLGLRTPPPPKTIREPPRGLAWLDRRGKGD